VVVSGTNAIIVNAGANDKVNLRGLDINGLGTGNPTSLVGVKVLSAKRVNIVDTEIYRFKAGVSIAPTTLPTSGNTKVVIARSFIHDSDIGVIHAPGGGVGPLTATIRDSVISDNRCGVVTSSFGVNASTPSAPSGTTDCGAAASPGFGQITTTRLHRNGIYDNEFGVFGRGGAASSEISNNEITGNTQFGLRRIDGALIKSYSNNVLNNSNSDAPTETFQFTKRKR
jgi:hypothetical protein